MFFRAIIFLRHLTSDLLWMVFRAIVFPKPLKELLRLQRCPAKAHNPLKQEPIARRKLSAASLTNGFMDPSLGNQSVVQYMRGFQKGNVWDLYMLEARIDSGLLPRSPTAPHHTINIFFERLGTILKVIFHDYSPGNHPHIKSHGFNDWCSNQSW